MKTKVFLKYFVRSCLWKQCFDCNLPQGLSNLISLTILVTLKPLTQFLLTIKATKFLRNRKIWLKNLLF